MELKPCPFCGGAVSMTYNSISKAFFFWHKNGKDEERCRVIEAISMSGVSLADAAQAWNRRVNPTERDGEKRLNGEEG